MAAATHRQQTIQQLARDLRRFERSERLLKHDGELFSTGYSVLDELLPQGGIAPGTLLEFFSAGSGSGAGTLAFIIAASVLQSEDNKSCVVIDPSRSFSPLGMLFRLRSRLQTAGLSRMVVVHPGDDRDALWAWEQSLRCPGVSVVVGWPNHLHNAIYRRLQLAAEAGGAIGLLLRPAGERGAPSWADLRLWVEPLPSASMPAFQRNAIATSRRLRIEWIHCRGYADRDAVELELDDETGDVRLAPQLAVATNPLRATGA